MLKIKNIDVFYDSLQVLKNISLEMNENESIGILGSNGHGKTTLLRTISGLLKTQKGTIELGDTVISNLSPTEIVKMGIIHVPQEAKLFLNMTVLENLMLGAYVPHAWKKRKESLESVFRLFSVLKERKNQKCFNLSGGERQMVAIGRGLMSSVKILMLDEPSLGLAPKTRQTLLNSILEIKETGIGMILVEQNISYIENIAERLYLIENGQIKLEGKKEEVLDHAAIKAAYLGMEE